MTQSAVVRKLSAFVNLSPDEVAVLDGFHARRRSIEIGRDIIEEGQNSHAAFILSKGWVCSYKLLPDGTRQIVDFQVPGDFLGLRSMLLRTSDHNCEPITAIEVSEVSKADLFEAFRRTPRLAAAVSGPRRATRPWWSSIWSISGGERHWRARRISCSSSGRG